MGRASVCADRSVGVSFATVFDTVAAHCLLSGMANAPQTHRAVNRSHRYRCLTRNGRRRRFWPFLCAHVCSARALLTAGWSRSRRHDFVCPISGGAFSFSTLSNIRYAALHDTCVMQPHQSTCMDGRRNKRHCHRFWTVNGLSKLNNNDYGSMEYFPRRKRHSMQIKKLIFYSISIGDLIIIWFTDIHFMAEL